MNMCKFMEDKESRNSKTARFNRVFSNLTIPVCTGSSRQEALTNALKNYDSGMRFSECSVTNEWHYPNSVSMFVSTDMGDFKITVIESKSVVGDKMIMIVDGLCVKG